MVCSPATARHTVALTISRHQNQTKPKLYLGLGQRRNNGKQEGISLSTARVEPPCPLSEPRTINWWALSLHSTLLLGGALSHCLWETFTQNRLTCYCKTHPAQEIKHCPAHPDLSMQPAPFGDGHSPPFSSPLLSISFPCCYPCWHWAVCQS